MSKRTHSDQKENNIEKDIERHPIDDSDISEIESPFKDDEVLEDDKMFIECPGATVYDPETRKIIAGVEWLDENDPSKGYRIIDQQVFAPEHRRKRLIKKEHYNSIRRCQACQDLTVRLMRREGPDFFIPSPKHPKKTRLKSVEKNW